MAPGNVISKIKQNSCDMNIIILAPCDVISKVKQNSSDMNKIILAPYDVISKIKQNSSDMNEIILTPCDAGYVQSCTGFDTLSYKNAWSSRLFIGYYLIFENIFFFFKSYINF
jgi:hypothetical protein